MSEDEIGREESPAVTQKTVPVKCFQSEENLPSVSGSYTVIFDQDSRSGPAEDNPFRREQTSSAASSAPSSFLVAKSQDTFVFHANDAFDEFSATPSAQLVSRPKSGAEIEKSMASRRSSESKQGLAGRTKSDLERRKLEIELKATEEIAKIRQAVIEKRLELDLATLTENDDFVRQDGRSLDSHDLRAMEEMAMSKQMILEDNLAEESDSVEYQKQAVKPRSPPPVPSRQRGAEPGKHPRREPLYLTRSSSDTRNALGIRLPGSRDARTPVASSNKLIPEEVEYRTPVEVRYMTRTNGPAKGSTLRPGPPGSARAPEQKNTSVWKSIMSKVKKKFKSEKNSEDWR